ncbi:hypothetical protein R6Q57_000602 [Mikania cordata]
MYNLLDKKKSRTTLLLLQKKSNNPTICKEGDVGLLHGQIHQCALGRWKLFLDCCRDVTSMKKLQNQEQKRISS